MIKFQKPLLIQFKGNPNRQANKTTSNIDVTGQTVTKGTTIKANNHS